MVILKPGELIISVKDVDVVVVPDVPVIVTVDCPGVAVLLAVRFRLLFAVAGFGEKDPVTPLGKPDTVSATLPVKPY